MTSDKIMTITFQNEQGRFTVNLKQEDAVAMIYNTPALAGEIIDAKTGETIIFADAIFKALKIEQSETS